MDIFEKIKQKHVIPAIRDIKDISVALGKGNQVLFLLTGDIFDLLRIKDEFISSKDTIFLLHLDLVKGVARDRVGIRFLKKNVGIDGVISTHANLIQYARKEGLTTIQRLFVIDSESLKKGTNLVQNCMPDGVEILPGMILPYITEELRHINFPPIVAGGIIKTEQDVLTVIQSGAIAVSTSRKELWEL